MKAYTAAGQQTFLGGRKRVAPDGIKNARIEACPVKPVCIEPTEI
jgi:hypothetical protein